jgi:hypothetical protein
MLECTVESVAVDGMEEDSKPSEDEKPGGEVTPNAEEPVMMMVGQEKKPGGY